MNIQPMQIWNNGTMQTVTQLNLSLVWDNLLNEAKFYFQMLTADNVDISSGNLYMIGADYSNWNTTTDINLAAYQWAATQLNVTLI
jgi:hypothetical protein